jgi:cobalt-zinc-cadmium efflux system outer membrane protein
MKNKNIIWILSSIVCLLFTNTSSAQELQELLRIALENNPNIQQLQSQHKRVSEKQQEASALPNTEIGVGVFASEPETRTGAQTFKVSVKQMIPFFGTITARENYAKAMADVAYQDIVIAKRRLVTQVTQSYYRLLELKAQETLLDEHLQLIKTYEKLALTSVSVGKASAVDVLKLQIRQNEITQQQAILNEQMQSEKVQLNNLLNRATSTNIVVTEALHLPEEQPLVANEKLKLHPELIKYERLYHSVEKSEVINQKQQQPMIGFGVDYINVAKRPNMNFSDNGKDIIMPMVSVSIPIFNTKYKSLSKQYQFKKNAIEAQKQQRYNDLETQLQQAISKRNIAFITYKTQRKNRDQANKAQEILMKSYETGTIDFNDVLDIQELQLKFQMNMITATTHYFNQSIRIQYLTQDL